MPAERLQKILSRAGVASRRGAEQVMAEGRVTVNGETIRELGTKADVAVDDIRVDGVRVKPPPAPVYLLLYKPRGVVTTRHDPEGRPTVMDLVPPVAGLFPVGRLDVGTEGILILTNDGAFAERVSHPRYEVARVYQAKVRDVPTQDTLARLTAGVRVDGERLAADRAKLLEADNNSWIELTLHEGKNHEVRRLMEAVGHPVSKLKRISIGPVTSRGLAPGQFRHLSPQEIRALTLGGKAARPPKPDTWRRRPAAGAARSTPRPPLRPDDRPRRSGTAPARRGTTERRPTERRPHGAARLGTPPAAAVTMAGPGERGLVIAIDGPSGAGKSTAGRVLAGRLGYVFLDTGAMYRAFALKALRARVATGDETALAALLRDTDIALRPDGSVLMDGADITGDIRTREVSAGASQVSVHPAVRRLMVARQQEMGRRGGGVVMDGRDIGTAVFPDADVKFFVHADPARRAVRRRRELAEAGIHAELDAIEREIRERDHADSTRADSPLIRAGDAVDVDTTELELEEVVSRMLRAVDAVRARRG